MSEIIKVENLKKHFGDIAAVNGISFDVGEGALFAFLGPNGAGKSTTINIICTILSKDSGDVRIDGCVLGKDDSDIRSRIGVVFQESLLDSLLTVKENLQTRGAFYGLSASRINDRITEIAKAVNITEFLNRPYGKLSGGQRRRADIARALINTPKILFLDEPTTGLDPQTRLSVWETVRELQREQGVAVFLTTHYMEEAALADDIAIIDHGVIAARGTPAELKVKYSSDHLHIIPKDSNAFLSFINSKGYKVEAGAGMFTMDIENSMQGLAILKEAESLIENFELIRGNMDDVFINITGRALRGEGANQ